MGQQTDDEALVKQLPGFSNGYTSVNGIRLHYVIGGSGAPLILIPGWPETWWAYHKVMPLLAEHYQVIVVDLRGMGGSDKPAAGYEKKNMATDIFELVRQLGFEKVHIAGHDIGAHVAFSFAANYPAATSKVVILDTPHPDPGMYHLPMLPLPSNGHVYPWWLAFNQVKELPEQLLQGRMNIVLDWIFKYLLIDENSISAFDRAVYTANYDTADGIRGGNAWYQALSQDIEDMKGYEKLTMPVLGLGGSGYDMLQMCLPATATDLQLAKVESCGHFLFEEKPAETAAFMIDFLKPAL